MVIQWVTHTHMSIDMWVNTYPLLNMDDSTCFFYREFKYEIVIIDEYLAITIFNCGLITY